VRLYMQGTCVDGLSASLLPMVRHATPLAGSLALLMREERRVATSVASPTARARRAASYRVRLVSIAKAKGGAEPGIGRRGNAGFTETRIDQPATLAQAGTKPSWRMSGALSKVSAAPGGWAPRRFSLRLPQSPATALC
jgi:hypothetical protein